MHPSPTKIQTQHLESERSFQIWCQTHNMYHEKIVIFSLKICADLLIPLVSKMKPHLVSRESQLDYHSIQVKDICNTAAFVFS